MGIYEICSYYYISWDVVEALLGLKVYVSLIQWLSR